MRSKGCHLVMYNVILTELGISIFDDKICKKSFSFLSPAKEYVAIKNGDLESNELLKFLVDLNIGVVVSDEAL